MAVSLSQTQSATLSGPDGPDVTGPHVLHSKRPHIPTQDSPTPTVAEHECAHLHALSLSHCALSCREHLDTTFLGAASFVSETRNAARIRVSCIRGTSEPHFPFSVMSDMFLTSTKVFVRNSHSTRFIQVTVCIL